VMAASIFETSIRKYSGSQSTSTGRAPTCMIASAVAI